MKGGRVLEAFLSEILEAAEIEEEDFVTTVRTISKGARIVKKIFASPEMTERAGEAAVERRKRKSRSREG
jgi:hypothetical protein